MKKTEHNWVKEDMNLTIDPLQKELANKPQYHQDVSSCV